MLYYYDDDVRTFNVVGPITDDSYVGQQTLDILKSGRKVRISTTDPEIDIKKVPSLVTCINRGPEGYKHDPNLRW